MLIKGNIHWHREADVIVVGLGGAGAAAAITAHDEGAHVVVLEKQASAGHMSNTSMSGGYFITINDAAGALEYMKHLNRVGGGMSWTGEDIIQSWSEYSLQNSKWLESLGAHPSLRRRGGEHRYAPKFESIDTHWVDGMGYGLMRRLKENLQTRGVEVLYETEAGKLLTNGQKVVGVRARKDGEEFNVRASRGVVLCTGGFEFNEDMKLNYLKVYPTHFYGAPANTGDGVRMVQEVGGSLWHMNCCSARMVAKFPDFPIAFGLDLGGRGSFLRFEHFAVEGEPCGFVIVDKYGRRFTNDGEMRPHSVYYELSLYDSQRLDYPRIPSYWIFDTGRMQRSPLAFRHAGPTGAHRAYKWSDDNCVELDKGWIVQGETVRELGKKLNMDPAVLENTIRTYNSYANQGSDPEFSRPARHMKPLREPPFFAVRLWPGGPNTQGGPRRSRKAEVLNGDGEPIPGLYAAGELGSIFGMLYPAAGANIGECIAFGRIAGENASRA